MTRSFPITAVIALLISAFGASAAPAEEKPASSLSLAGQFQQPPASARPWVWAHWMEGNVDRSSIVHNLDQLTRVGIGGLTLFDVGENTFDKQHNGIPKGPHDYFSPSWQELFRFEIGEAAKRGLDTMAHAGPGWSGNGGPWIPAELACQKVVTSETRVPAGTSFDGKLPQPETNGNFYRDIAVFAIRETEAQSRFRIEDFDFKRVDWLKYVRWRGTRSAPPDATVPAGIPIPQSDIIRLTGAMKPDGSIRWTPPADAPGDWTLIRMGHTWTGQITLPAPDAGIGPECDKLDKRGIRAHFNHVHKRLAVLGGKHTGRGLSAWFVDSWEAGGQNWTPILPAEFNARRGYDMTPYLPILAGRVINDLQTTERFLFDLRLTLSELVTENFWAELRRLSNQQGMKVAAQVYITAGNDFDAANHVDEPMGECWSHSFQPNDYRLTIKAASAAATLNGRGIVGVEAFTSTDTERWTAHPATMKPLADQMFALGANRLQFHCFAMQRFPQLKPGMMMGKWGTHYDATQTWWDWTIPWHQYLTRCQFLLRQGRVAADVLVATPEEPLYRYEATEIPGYDSHACGPDTFRSLVVENGLVRVPNGPAFPLLVVKHLDTMSVERAKQILSLVEAGARVLVESCPKATPGLSGFPHADGELKSICTKLWGAAMNAPESGKSGLAHGKGVFFTACKPDEALAAMGIQPDFTTDVPLAWIHRSTPEHEIYFVASSHAADATVKCAFRVAGRRAEWWNPETGTTQTLAAQEKDGLTHLQLALAPHESGFVVFCDPNTPAPQAQPPRDVAHPAEIASLSGPWSLQFPADSGAPASIQLHSLIPWNEHADPSIRHFSGTATYRSQFNLPENTPNTLALDLGRVEVMARVKLNGTDLGILWKPPYRTRIAHAVKPGPNALEIQVVNLWPNRLIGDDSLPQDSKRSATGRLEEWPEWVLQGKSSPTGRRSFVTLPQWSQKDSLLPSGLIGPVRLLDPSVP